MKLLSIHIGKSAVFVGNGKERRSGIDKKMVLSARVEDLGLVGDVQVDKKHHGGPDQAVYAYSKQDYDWFESHYPIRPWPGSFGENLLFDTLDANRIYVGDRFQIGEVLLEVSAPRIPCSTLSDRLKRPSFIKEFRDAARPGIYFRVIETGDIVADLPVEYSRGDYDISVVDFFHFYYAEKSKAELERYLSAPIDIRSRTSFENSLANLA